MTFLKFSALCLFLLLTSTRGFTQEYYYELSGNERYALMGRLGAWGETEISAFNRIVFASQSTPEAVRDRIIALRNVIDVMGGASMSAPWQLVQTVKFYPGSTIVQIRVKDRWQFLEALKRERDPYGRAKYAVNDTLDRMFSNHPNDSIRQRTEYSTDFPIHFANEDAGGDTLLYNIHFDSASPYFRTPSQSSVFWSLLPGGRYMKEAIWAGKQHSIRYVTPTEVRNFLKSRGMASDY